MLEEDKEFDLKIRSILKDGQEEVPDYLWEAVQKRLPAKKDRPVVTWLRRSAIAVAAAAAAAVVLFLGPELFTGSRHNAGQPMDLSADAGIQVIGKSSASAEDTSSDEMPSLAAASPLLTDGATVSASPAMDRAVPQSVTQETGQAAISGHPAGTASPAEAGMSEYQAETGTSEKIQDAESTERALDTESTEKTQDTQSTERTSAHNDGHASSMARWDDSDALDADIDAVKRKPSVAMTISGNAVGNNPQGKSSRSFAPMQSSGIPPANSLHEDRATSYAIPLSFGAGVKIFLNSRWAIGAGLNYSLLNRTLSGIYYDEDSTPYSDSDIFNSQSYIGIPVNVYFSILKKDFIDLYAYAGGTVEKCVSSTYQIDAPGQTITYREGSRGVQMSADLGIGVEFLVTDRLGIYIDPSIRYYFKSRQPESIRTVQPLMIGFEAGLRVRL